VSTDKMAAAVRNLALVAALGVAAALCLVVPAAADEIGPANPAPMPAPGVTDGAGPNDLAALVPGVIAYRWNGPRLTAASDTVEGSVTVSGFNAFGGASYFDIYLQTKACGFWGCNWEERAKAEGIYVPANGVVNSPVLTMPRRQGVNSYRLRLQYSHPVVDIEGRVPYIQYQSEQVLSWTVEM